MMHSALGEIEFRTSWDNLGHFRPYNVPILFPTREAILEREVEWEFIQRLVLNAVCDDFEKAN